jgi:hypothetical protein
VKIDKEPHASRPGHLKNNNRPGDFSKAPKCGARTRRGRPCRAPAMANGRCRMHGGLSTGPKTSEGIERIRSARTKHGQRSAQARAERAAIRELIRRSRETLAQLRNAVGQVYDRTDPALSSTIRPSASDLNDFCPR